ncbi:MAG: hypothetical protein CVU62_02310 [Deltaproteobacteria bacterium HGW-Deltaproteobacteria-2]|jgi:hypothetical protein|nr:MAG: hypothetical protein CVU62_02310 [Deltaproteobacteria bacterium HGW-Deltaproteobacteria-2]
MKKIIIALFIFCFFSTALAQDVDLLWKARALQGLENLKKMEKQLNSEKQVKNDDLEKLKYEAMLEAAYAMIIGEPETTVKKTSLVAAYHLIISFGDDGMLDVVYLYDIKTYKYISMRVDKIPKNRGIVFLQNNKYCDFITVVNYLDTKDPLLIFSKNDPFNASVMQH